MKFYECPNCGKQVAEQWEISSTIFMLSTNKSCSKCNEKIELNKKILFAQYLMAFLIFILITFIAGFLNDLLKSTVPYSGYITIIIWGILVLLINLIVPYIAGSLMQQRIFMKKKEDL